MELAATLRVITFGFRIWRYLWRRPICFGMPPLIGHHYVRRLIDC